MSIYLNPQKVIFNDLVMEHVKSLRIDRTVQEVIAENTTGGPHVTYGEIKGPRVLVFVERDFDEDFVINPVAGEQGQLSFEVALGRSDSRRHHISLIAMVTSVCKKFNRNQQAYQTISFLGISPDGTTDPIVVT